MIHSEPLRRFAACVCTSAVLAAIPSSGTGQTIGYQYDELGRLKTTSQSGGAAGGVATGVAYDAAGNRTNYSVSGSGGSAPPPPPPPPPSNTAPVANADYLSRSEYQSGTINAVANDTDADGDYPLSIVSVSDPSGNAYKASASHIGWYGSPAGTYYVSYTIQDSRGATASGTLRVTVTWSDPCGGQICQ